MTMQKHSKYDKTQTITKMQYQKRTRVVFYSIIYVPFFLVHTNKQMKMFCINIVLTQLYTRFVYEKYTEKKQFRIYLNLVHFRKYTIKNISILTSENNERSYGCFSKILTRILQETF